MKRKPKVKNLGGRPPLRGIARTSVLAVRLSAEELANLKARAAAAGLGVSPFVLFKLEAEGLLNPL